MNIKYCLLQILLYIWRIITNVLTAPCSIVKWCLYGFVNPQPPLNVFSLKFIIPKALCDESHKMSHECHAALLGTQSMCLHTMCIYWVDRCNDAATHDVNVRTYVANVYSCF